MIKTDWPPNIDQVAAVFPHVAAAVKGEGDNRILFAYGEDIYNPSGGPIPQAMLAHEYKHCARQFVSSPTAWWDAYLRDPEFRYGEELLAHVEEYIAQAALITDRNARARLSMRTASRLVAPLYNYQPPRSLKEAMRDIEALV